MASLAERWKSLFAAIKQGSTASSAWWRIADDHVLDGNGAGSSDTFVADVHYFVVRLHQAHLAASRQWFTQYDPLLFVHTEFKYAGEWRREPFVVGPETLRNKAQQSGPAGMSITDIHATELRPYRGGGLDLTVLLYRGKVDDSARRLLSIAERCVALPGLSALVGPYVQVAEAGLDALEAALGLDEAVPMLGSWQGFDSTAGFRPGWFVLAQAGALTPDQMWVRDNRLLCGSDPDHLAEPGADFVLCSLGQAQARDDVGEIAEFRHLWKSVMAFANQSGEEAWRVAKALMSALQLTVLQSPDLTPSQARALVDRYRTSMVAVREQARQTEMLSGGKEPDPLTRGLATTLAL